MSIFSEKAAIIASLATVPGIKHASEAWPTTSDPRPCITVTIAGERSTDRRDDAPFLREYEFYVRLFVGKKQSVDKYTEQIQEAMEGLDYEKTFLWEEPGADARQVVMRYKKTT